MSGGLTKPTMLEKKVYRKIKIYQTKATVPNSLRFYILRILPFCDIFQKASYTALRYKFAVILCYFWQFLPALSCTAWTADA